MEKNLFFRWLKGEKNILDGKNRFLSAIMWGKKGKLIGDYAYKRFFFAFKWTKKHVLLWNKSNKSTMRRLNGKESKLSFGNYMERKRFVFFLDLNGILEFNGNTHVERIELC